MGEGPAASPSWSGRCLKSSDLCWQSPLPRHGSAPALGQPLLTGLGLQKVAAPLCPVGEPLLVEFHVNTQSPVDQDSVESRWCGASRRRVLANEL